MLEEKKFEASDPSCYTAVDLLRDGSTILVRAIKSHDKERLFRHFSSLSPQAVYNRFFGFKRTLDDADLKRLTEVDFVRHVALAATLGSGSDERFIGVGRFIVNDSGSAEVAFAVLDEFQGRGIGTILLKHLGSIALAAGVKQFTANVLSTNHPMLEVFGGSGFRTHDSYESGVVCVVLDLAESRKMPR